MTKSYQKNRLIAAKKILKVCKNDLKDFIVFYEDCIKPTSRHYESYKTKLAYCYQCEDNGKYIFCNGYIFVALNDKIEGIDLVPENYIDKYSLKTENVKQSITGEYEDFDMPTLKEIKAISKDDFHKYFKEMESRYNCFQGMNVWQLKRDRALVDIDKLITLLQILCDNDKEKVMCKISTSPVKPIVIKTNNGWGMLCPVRQKNINHYYDILEEFTENNENE